MEANELIERFDTMRVGDALLRKCFAMLATSSPKYASHFLDCLEGMETFNNFLTEDEAVTIVGNFENADGTSGAKWSPDTLFTAVQNMGGIVEQAPRYNRWALYAVMNMMNSDHYPVLQKWCEGDESKYAEACYDLAVSQLNDRDKPHWVREYFGV